MQHSIQLQPPVLYSNGESPAYRQGSLNTHPTASPNIYQSEHFALSGPTTNIYPSTQMLANGYAVARGPTGFQQPESVQQAYMAAQQQALWTSSMLTPPIVSNPQLPALRTSVGATQQQSVGPISPPNSAVFPPQPHRGRGQPSRVPMQTPSQVQRPVSAQTNPSRSSLPMLNVTPSQGSRLIPPSSFVIDRSQYPHSHHEPKSLFMSLHQAHVRSPPRTGRVGETDERHYQSVQSLILSPFRLTYCHDVEFGISPDDFARIYQRPIPLSASTTTHQYWHGSLRFRIRCCRLRSDGPPGEFDWVGKDTMWPQHIFIDLNGHKLSIRREAHNGKDLPAEVTDHVLPGKNRLKVIVPHAGPTAPDRKGNIFYLAVEVIETVRHSDLLCDIQQTRRHDRQITLDKIRSRVTAAPEEDGISIVDRSGGNASELSIGLTDPFSSSIFNTPARGIGCAHMECFDLETWLDTRPKKSQIKCGHKGICTCPKNQEPSEPDKWKCPICSGDARPKSLYIDGFLADVRHELQKQNKLQTRTILVSADGKWRLVDQVDDDDDEGSDGDGPAPKGSAPTNRDPRPATKSASVERRTVGVIELD